MRLFHATLTAATLAFGAASLFAAPLAAQEVRPTVRLPTLAVSGEGSATAVPDMARFSTGVVSTAKTAGEALAANTRDVGEMIAAVKAAGVEPRDIATSGFSVQPQYATVKTGSNEAPRIVGYEVRNTVSVRLRDLARLGSLLDEVVTKGANQIGGIDFDVAEPAKLEDAARVAAVVDARRQAELIAEAAGVRLVRILSITEDSAGPSPMPRMLAAAPMSKREAVPVEAGEAELRARISVVYEIEPR